MITGTAEVGRTLCSVTSTVTRPAGVTSYTSRTTFRFCVSFQSVRRSQYSLDGQFTMPFASPVGNNVLKLRLTQKKIHMYIYKYLKGLSSFFLYSLIATSPEVQISFHSFWRYYIKIFSQHDIFSIHIFLPNTCNPKIKIFRE